MPKAKEKGEFYDAKFVAQMEKVYNRCAGLAEQGMTRQGFAKFLGVSYATYCNWREGRSNTRPGTKDLIGLYARLKDDELKKRIMA